MSAVMRKTTDVKLDWFTNFLGDQKSEGIAMAIRYNCVWMSWTSYLKCSRNTWDMGLVSALNGSK